MRAPSLHDLSEQLTTVSPESSEVERAFGDLRILKDGIRGVDERVTRLEAVVRKLDPLKWRSLVGVFAPWVAYLLLRVICHALGLPIPDMPD